MALTKVTAGVFNVNDIFGFRNRIINGDMRIDQRNAGASVTVNSTTSAFPVDRFFATGQSTDGVFTVQRSSVAPTGFTNSVIVTVTTADASIGASQRYFISQGVEGVNWADMMYGSASAQTATLSFWVRSSLTGTFGGSIRNNATTRSYPFSYTISAANTWEQKTITFTGDTTGTWLADTSGAGVYVSWSLGAGSSFQGTANAWNANNNISVTGETALIGTNGATLYITGVQLEKGSSATPFDYRPYGTELQLAQRYAYPVKGGYSGFGNGTTVVDAAIQVPVEMRVVPTVTQGTLVYQAFGTGSSYTQSSALNSLPTTFTQTGGTLRFSNFSGLTGNSPYIITPSSGGTITTYACILTAEL